MIWERKIVYYLLLTYFIYGILNIIYLGDFVVPLPISFLFIIIVSFLFIITSKFSYYTLICLTIPFLVLKDLIIFYNKNIGIVMLLLGIISMFFLGIKIINRIKNNRTILILGLLLILSPIHLINIDEVSIVYSIIMVFTILKLLQSSIKLDKRVEKTIFIVLFVKTIFLLNNISNWLSS